MWRRERSAPRVPRRPVPLVRAPERIFARSSRGTTAGTPGPDRSAVRRRCPSAFGASFRSQRPVVSVRRRDSALSPLRCRHPRWTWPAKGARRTADFEFFIFVERRNLVSSLPTQTDEARTSEAQGVHRGTARGAKDRVVLCCVSLFFSGVVVIIYHHWYRRRRAVASCCF